MVTLFISDLHLDASAPEIGEQFLQFLRTDALGAEALYILGDLFEYWIGDDDPSEYYAQLKSAIREVADCGIPVSFMRGNRDFLIGSRFAEETGATILDDPCLVNLYGQNVLLSHGDALCTDDVEYQQFRSMSRNPEWQQAMLEKSLEERHAYARQAREASMEHGSQLTEAISDVNADAVALTMREHDVNILLHGHTHRPAIHEFSIDGKPATRIVLGDWYDQGSVLSWDESGYDLTAMPRQAAPSGSGT
jgi:UDP-2,3-diacylglucosamine hydrolase